MAKSKKLLVQIPFSGFYETTHSYNLDRALEDYFSNPDTGSLDEFYTIPEDFHYTFDKWKTIERDYCKKYLNGFEDRYQGETGLDTKFTYESMTSPREYNFETDRLFALVSLKDIKEIRDYVKDSFLEAQIKEDCTSYDGFISFYSNDIADWKAKPLKTWDHNELQILLKASLVQSGVNTRSAWESFQDDCLERLIGNGMLDEICYSHFSAWEAEHPQTYKLACKFLDVLEDDYKEMSEEDQAALIAQYEALTYHCPMTLELPLGGNNHANR